MSIMSLDLASQDLRSINRILQGREAVESTDFEILNSLGAHSIAAGLMHDIDVTVKGHVGYYCGGMNKDASITIEGNAGTGVGENMMSGTIIVKGDASQAAGATAHGGLLVVHGNASARCAISLKGADVVIGGSVGHNTAFMAQSGTLVICGDAEEGLGDSIYETVIYLRGKAKGLGADCIEKPMRDEDYVSLAALLEKAGISHDPKDFRRYGSARELYNFKIDNVGAY